MELPEEKKENKEGVAGVEDALAENEAAAEELGEIVAENGAAAADNEAAQQGIDDAAGSEVTRRGKKKMHADARIALIAIIVASLLVVAVPPFAVYQQDREFERQAELARQHHFIWRSLHVTETHGNVVNMYGGLFAGVEQIARRAPNGQPYYIGKIRPELSEKLPEYIAAYNADPHTLYPVTEEEVRYGLTEGLYETFVTGENEAAYRLILFFKWCQYHLRAGELS